MAGIMAKQLSRCNHTGPQATFFWNTSHFNRRNLTTTSNSTKNNIVYMDGVRTPFLIANTDYSKLLAHDLARESLVNLQKKTNISKEAIGYVVYGSVLEDVKTCNIAQEALLAAGYSNHTRGHTVITACTSGNMALTTAVGSIKLGLYDTIVAGGFEFTSDVPSRHSRSIRSLIANKAKAPMEYLAILTSIRGKNFAPDLQTEAEFSTDETVGHSVDIVAAAFNVSREDQDGYALRSHTLAAQAHEKGYLTDMIPVVAPGFENAIDKDNGVWASTEEQLAKLKPTFVKPYDTVTAANASFLSDGASAGLIMKEEKAKQLGLTPKAYIKEFIYFSRNSIAQLLLGPAYAISKVLDKTGLTMEDIGVWEVHETFAAHILVNLKALDSDVFAQKYLKRSKKIGVPELSKWNSWGGSLSIGHPFAATGIRLMTQAANRMIRENQQFSLIAACAAIGPGVAMILERHPDAKL